MNVKATVGAHFPLSLAVALWLPALFASAAQVGGVLGKDVMFPDYYPLLPGQTNQPLRTLVRGAEVTPLPGGGKYDIHGLRLESYRRDGQLELAGQATECVFDVAARVATGAGHLRVWTTNGLFAVEGDGFTWRQNDGLLVISNRAVTTLNRALLTLQTNDLLGMTNALPVPAVATGQVIRVSSERCVFNSQSNQVLHTGQVRLDDPQMEMSCDSLAASFTPGRRLQHLLAERDVSILNKADQSRATAGRALYGFDAGGEWVQLEDQPVWRDQSARQEARASRFQLDLREKILRGGGGAMVRLPRSAFNQPSLFPAPGASLTNAPPAPNDTNQVEITGEALTLFLVASNRPHRSAMVETNVLVVSPADDTRARGHRMTYHEASGLAELLGQAQWAAEGRLMKADVLIMDRTNQVLRGQGHTSFRLPLAPFLRTNTVRGASRQSTTNLFLEVTADSFVRRTNTLTFLGSVQARLLDGQTLRGWMNCGALTVWLSTRLESLLAEKHVAAEHYPPPDHKGKVVTNLLSCETLSAQFSESGQVVAVVACEHVQAAQIEARSPKSLLTQLTCSLLTAVVLPGSGQVDKLQAEQHVVVSQEDKLARGDFAVYTARLNRLELTGHPVAEFASGKITDADALMWDRASGAFHGQGKYHLEWHPPAGHTNRFAFPLPTK
jgi:hypothetical protein